MAVGDIVVRISGDSRGYTSALRRARTESARFNQSVTSGAKASALSMRSLEKATFRLRARMIGLRAVAAGTTAFFTGRGIVQYADQWKLAEARIGSVTNNLEVAKGEMQEILALANRTRGSVDTLAGAYSKLRLSRNELTKDTTFTLLETLQKSLLIGGNTPQEVRSVILQLTQGIAADQLGGEELRTIRESGFFFQKILAEGLGVTVGELKQLGAESKLTTRAVAEAVVSMAGRVNEAFEDIPTTVGQSATIFNNNLRAYIASVDSASGATGILAEGILVLGKNIGSIASGALLVGVSASVLRLSRSVGNYTGELAKGRLESIASAAATRRKAQGDLFALNISRQATQIEIGRARAAVQVATSELRLATTQKQRTIASAQLTAATKQLFAAEVAATRSTQALAAANRTLSLSARAAAASSGALRGILAFFGGPVGVGITAIAAGFALWARNARKAKEETQKLLRASQNTIDILTKAQDGQLFFTSLTKEKAIEQATSDIDRFNKSIDEAAKKLKSLDRLETGFERPLGRADLDRQIGKIGGKTTERVPGRQLSASETAEQIKLEKSLVGLINSRNSAQKALNEINKATILTEEQLIKKQKELNSAVSNFGPEEPPKSFTSAITDLKNKVSELRSEYTALGAGEDTKSAILFQRTINGLLRDGVTVTDPMRAQIQALTQEYAKLSGQINTSREFSKAIAGLRSDVGEARAGLSNIINVNTSGSAGTQKALEVINDLVAKNVQVTPTMRAEITKLANEFGNLEQQTKAAQKAQEAHNDKVDAANNLVKQFRTPLEVYRDQLADIQRLQSATNSQGNPIVSQTTAARAQAQAFASYQSSIQRARSEQEKFAQSLAESVLHADSIGDAIRNVGDIIQKAITDRFLVQPLTNAINNGVGSLGASGLFASQQQGPPQVGPQAQGQGAQQQATQAITQLGASAAQAGQNVKTGFIPSIVQSVTGLFTNRTATTAASLANTKSAATTAAAAAAQSAKTTQVISATAAMVAFTAAVKAATAAQNASSTDGGAGGSGGNLAGGVSAFAGFFASGGVIPQGKFGVVGEAGPELISAASSSLRVTPLSSVSNAGAMTQKATVYITAGELFDARVQGNAAKVAVPVSTGVSQTTLARQSSRLERSNFKKLA